MKGKPKGRGEVFVRNQDRHQRSARSQSNHDCQEGNPLGANYSGIMNVTTSGFTCQVWSASQPNDHDFTHVGEHNYCRNPDADPEGVWCVTTDPEETWEYCSVPICASNSSESYLPTDNYLSAENGQEHHRSISSQGYHECQGGDPLGSSYSGRVNLTVSGKICDVWDMNDYDYDAEMEKAADAADTSVPIFSAVANFQAQSAENYA